MHRAINARQSLSLKKTLAPVLDEEEKQIDKTRKVLSAARAAMFFPSSTGACPSDESSFNGALAPAVLFINLSCLRWMASLFAFPFKPSIEDKC